MAELTVLETKLAEVLGLAQAALGAGTKISNLVEDEQLKSELDRMTEEAAETEERCTQLAEGLNGKKTAILEKARETKQEATEMITPNPPTPKGGRRGRRSRRARPRRHPTPRRS